MLRASDDATSGSVIAKPDRISPASSGSSHCDFCSGGAEQHQGLHVPGVRRPAVDHLGRDDRRPAGDLGDRGVLQVGQPGQLVVEQVPQPARAGLGLELLDHRRQAVVVVPALAAPGVVDRLGGEHVFPHEVPHPAGDVLGLGRQREVHARTVTAVPRTGAGRSGRDLSGGRRRPSPRTASTPERTGPSAITRPSSADRQVQAVVRGVDGQRVPALADGEQAVAERRAVARPPSSQP